MRRLLVFTCVIGCAASEGPEPRTQEEITTAQLARELPGGAAQLAPFERHYEPEPKVTELAMASSRDRASGRTLVDTTLTPVPDSFGIAQPRVSAIFSVDDAGQVRLFARGPEAVLPNGAKHRAVPGLGAIANCTASEANGVRLEGEGLVPFEDAPFACGSSDLAGESLRPGRWLLLEKTGAALRTTSRSVRGEAPETRSNTGAVGSDVVVWAREASDGAVSVVVRTATGFAWQDEVSPRVELVAPDASVTFEDALDAFVLRPADGSAIVWSPKKGSEQRLASPWSESAPLVTSGASTLPFAEVSAPNPTYTSNRIPSRYVVAVLRGTVQSVDARLTPCVDAARCRALGESYLLGTVDGPTPMGIYAFWSWESLETLVAAPLFPSSEVAP
jgi:hypothetical protein